MFVISPHSFVDLITNSSSELFIINSKKTAETVDEILLALWQPFIINLEQTDTEKASKLYFFTSVICPADIAEITLSLDKYPEAREYYSTRYDKQDSHPLYIECRNALRNYESKLEAHERYDYETELKFMSKWEDHRSEMTQKAVAWVVANNGLVNITDEMRYKIESELSYEISYNKGDILVRSVSDNTIPFDFMDIIQSTFNCRSFHLG